MKFSPIPSYLWPALKQESNDGNLYVFEIEGNEVRIKCGDNNSIYVYDQDNIIKEVSEHDAPGVTNIELSGHNLSIQYKDYPWDVLSWFSGFRIFIDNKPLENTYNDPHKQIKIASYAFFAYSALFFYCRQFMRFIPIVILIHGSVL